MILRFIVFSILVSIAPIGYAAENPAEHTMTQEGHRELTVSERILAFIRVLKSRVTELEEENSRLKEENARLRAMLDDK